MFKKTILTVIIFTLCISMVLTGCSSSKGTSSKPAEDGQNGVQSGDAGSSSEKTYRMLSVMAASNVNPHIASSSYDDEISTLINAGLYRYLPGEDRNSAYLGADLADGEPIKMDDRGQVWQIKINPDAKWANGDPINADTFIYSWKMALDPILLNPPAISLALSYIEIENAEKYYTQAADGITVDWEEVGIKKVDDYTVEIKATQAYTEQDVMRHFSARVTKAVNEKMYEEYMNDSRTATLYGTDKDKIVSAGPFILDEWIKGSERVFSKNAGYLHADEIKLDGVNVRIVKDAGTQLQMFENGELDEISLSPEGYLKYEEDPRIVVYPSRVIRHVEINRGNPDYPILGNLNFRKALYYAMDRKTMAELGKQKPAPYYVSTNGVAYADGTKFRDLPGANDYVPENYGYNPELAVELFNKALEEVGISKVSMTLNYYDSREDVKMMAEYQQKSLMELFGPDKFDLKLQALPNNQLFDTMKGFKDNPSSYELSWGSWSWSSGDFSPNRCFEPFQSDYSRANAPYNNKKLDKLYLESIQEEVRLDEKKVAEYAMKLEQEFLEDVIAIPIFEVVNKAMHSERVVFPVDTYQSGLSWGIKYADIVE